MTTGHGSPKLKYSDQFSPLNQPRPASTSNFLFYFQEMSGQVLSIGPSCCLAKMHSFLCMYVPDGQTKDAAIIYIDIADSFLLMKSSSAKQICRLKQSNPITFITLRTLRQGNTKLIFEHWMWHTAPREPLQVFLRSWPFQLYTEFKDSLEIMWWRNVLAIGRIVESLKP